MQGRGLATVLIAHLAQVAVRARGHDLHRDRLPENRRMISVFRESGFPVEVRASPDGIELEFPTELGEDARRRFEDRDRVAAVAAVERVLRPARWPWWAPRGGRTRSAARRSGTCWPTGSAASSTRSTRTRTSSARGARPGDQGRPGPVDLAIVAVPAESGRRTSRASAREAGVGALVVITAGFAEAGAEGAARLAELLEICRASGMRLVGPNCMGVVNTDPTVSLTATFARADVPAGTIGFVSQCGAFGAAAIDGMSRRGIGLSAFVSLGDKADLSSNDFLQYWEQDPATQVVALYLESFGNPRKFGRVARRVARAKPVLAVKAGRTSAGARAASLAHRRADRRLRRHRRRAVRQRGRDPLRRARRPAGRRRRARRAAAAGRERRGDRRQRPRAAASSAPTRARTPGWTSRACPRPQAALRGAPADPSSPARSSSSRRDARGFAPRSSTSPPTPRSTR